MSKMLYKEYYRTRGVRYSTSLIDPPTSPFDQLPKNSLFHYVSADVVESDDADIDESLTIFEGYQKKIHYETVLELFEPEGPIRKLSVDTKYERTKWKQRNRDKWVPGERAWLTAQSQEDLHVVNYGYTDKTYAYLKVKQEAYHRWHNRFKTVWKTVSDIAKECDRNQFIVFNVPNKLVGKTFLDRFAPIEPTIQMLDIFEDHNGAGFAHLDMWRFLGVTHRSKSVMSMLDPAHYKRVNLVFIGKSNRPVIINLAYLNSWIKGQPNTSDLTSMVQQDVLMIQKLYLKLCMIANGLNDELADEQSVEVKPQAAPVEKPEVAKVDTDSSEAEDLIEEDRHELEAEMDSSGDDAEGHNQYVSQVVATKVAPGRTQGEIDVAALVSKPPVSFDKQLLDSLEKDIEALDSITAIQVENAGVSMKKLDIEEPSVPSIDPEVLREKVFGSPKPGDRLKKKIADQAENNVITAAQYRKFEQLISSYQSSPDPYGTGVSRSKAMIIKDEDLKFEDSVVKLKTSDGVVDKTMAESTLRSMNSTYVRNVLHKDILSVVDSFQKAGVIVKTHEVDVTENALGAIERHTLELQPINGQPSIVRFSVPKVDEEGKYCVSGNKYFARSQVVD